MSRTGAPPSPESLSDAQRQRRQRIVDTGLALLRSNAYHQIQMKDVAAAADVALGTVYRYFHSKDHLFAEVLAAWGRQLRTNVERRPLRGETNAERLTDVLHRSMRGFQCRPQLARVVMELEASSDPFTREIFACNNQENVNLWSEAIQDLGEPVTREVVQAASAVFDLQMRRWAVGAHSIADAYDHISQGVWLLLEFSERDPGAGASRPTRRRFRSAGAATG